MMEVVENFKVTLEFQTSVDTETGEVTTKCIKKSIDKLVNAVSCKRDESTTPQLIREDNKYRLNSAAVELLGVSPNDRLDIKYEKSSNGIVPVIGTDEAFGSGNGNRITKSNTVAYRGSRNEELAKYGTVFSILPHPTKEGLFILNGDLTSNPNPDEDENISTDDIDLTDLIDDATEVDSSIFKL